MIMNTNTNNIIKVNIHVFNRFTNKNEIVKVAKKVTIDTIFYLEGVKDDRD